MNKLCVFAGTTEGRELVEFLSGQEADVTACVATEYGETLLAPAEHLTVSAGRLTRDQMEAMFRTQRFDLVIDATHPYASAVTENIRSACDAAGCDYLRLLREASGPEDDAIRVPDISAAVERLNAMEGNIFLTTGSKELSRFTGIRDFAGRVYARVLPMADSLQLCRDAGLAPAHTICMQGPFPEELNIAMLRAVNASVLVTKESGKPGGFAEKASAARKAGAKLLVIGRPAQIPGKNFAGVLEILRNRFGFVHRPVANIVGIGPGGRGFLTQNCQIAVEKSDCLIGARRMLEAFSVPGKACFEAIAPGKIAEIIKNNPQFREFSVLMSGDTGFYSGTKKLIPLLSGCDVRILPGLSSLSVLCAKLGTSYDDVTPVSLHGRNRDILGDLRRHRRVFTLVGGENGAGNLCKTLVRGGFGDAIVHVGENLSYPDERITSGTAEALGDRVFAPLSAVLVEHHRPEPIVTPGLPDGAFLRGGSEKSPVPMTKSEVRAVCLSKLRLTRKSVCWDVGAGTGSVSAEMALLADSVWAIEKKPEALALLEQNRAAFGLGNLEIVPGTAPEACENLPAPTHVFIGGSSGNLRQIVDLARTQNPGVRIVATAIALETAAELTDLSKALPWKETETVMLTVARDRKAGPYHLMTGQNPVYIFTLEGSE